MNTLKGFHTSLKNCAENSSSTEHFFMHDSNFVFLAKQNSPVLNSS